MTVAWSLLSSAPSAALLLHWGPSDGAVHWTPYDVRGNLGSVGASVRLGPSDYRTEHLGPYNETVNLGPSDDVVHLGPSDDEMAHWGPCKFAVHLESPSDCAGPDVCPQGWMVGPPVGPPVGRRPGVHAAPGRYCGLGS
jgi:hypothetical protein